MLNKEKSLENESVPGSQECTDYNCETNPANLSPRLASSAII